MFYIKMYPRSSFSEGKGDKTFEVFQVNLHQTEDLEADEQADCKDYDHLK